MVAVALALVGTGVVSREGRWCHDGPAVLRNVVGGLLAMGVTYGIGSLVGIGLA